MKNNQLYWHRTYASLFIIVSFLSIVLFGWADATAGPTGSEKSETATLATADYYNTLQTITFSGATNSLEQHIVATITSNESVDESGQTYTLSFLGGINFPSEEVPTVVHSEEVIVTRNGLGRIKSLQPSLLHSMQVINDATDWAVAHKLPENALIQIPINLGNGVTSHPTMTFDFEPVQIGASSDTKLVTVKMKPRSISGISGLFQCEYTSMFVYSPETDKLYQSTSIFTASKGAEKIQIEELTYMTTEGGEYPLYPLIDSSSRIGNLESVKNKPLMTDPLSPWVIEALFARDSLYCASKAIVYEKTNWVYLSAFIADTVYSLMDYAWSEVAGESLVTSITTANKQLGNRLNRYDINGINCFSNEIPIEKALNLSATPHSELIAHNAKVVKITPDARKVRTVKTPVAASSGGDLLTTSLMIGGAGVAIAAGSSGGGGGGGGGGGACGDEPLRGNYIATVNSQCMGNIAQDISFDLTLNSSCSVTGSAIVFGGAPIAVDAISWSYAAGMLTIGAFSGAVAPEATTFTTPLEDVFPALAVSIRLIVDTLPIADQQEIVNNCGSLDNYVSNLTMTWTKG